MNYTAIFEKFGRPEKENRTAYIAALILRQSVKVEPVHVEDAAQYANGTVEPKAETMPVHIADALAQMLVNRAEQLHNLAEYDCNFGMGEHHQAKWDKLESEIGEIAAAAGFDVETGGDPRGCVVKLFDREDKRAGDGWGGGWGVYR